jgi:hypothetical protein
VNEDHVLVDAIPAFFHLENGGRKFLRKFATYLYGVMSREPVILRDKLRKREPVIFREKLGKRRREAYERSIMRHHTEISLLMS